MEEDVKDYQLPLSRRRGIGCESLCSVFTSSVKSKEEKEMGDVAHSVVKHVWDKIETLTKEEEVGVKNELRNFIGVDDRVEGKLQKV